jgi:hypothetical protein
MAAVESFKSNEKVLTQGVYRISSVILLSRARTRVWREHVGEDEVWEKRESREGRCLGRDEMVLMSRTHATKKWCSHFRVFSGGAVFVISNIKHRPERFAPRSTRFPNDAKRLATAASGFQK